MWRRSGREYGSAASSFASSRRIRSPEWGQATRFPSEDWDLLTQIRELTGWAGGYFPGPTVSHHHGRKRRQARKRIRGYNIGSGAVYLKLLANPRTRRVYLPFILRRVAGDMKYRQTKVAAQLYGAMLFLMRNWRDLLAATPDAPEPPVPDPHRAGDRRGCTHFEAREIFFADQAPHLSRIIIAAAGTGRLGK